MLLEQVYILWDMWRLNVASTWLVREGQDVGGVTAEASLLEMFDDTVGSDLREVCF